MKKPSLTELTARRAKLVAQLQKTNREIETIDAAIGKTTNQVPAEAGRTPEDAFTKNEPGLPPNRRTR